MHKGLIKKWDTFIHDIPLQYIHNRVEAQPSIIIQLFIRFYSLLYASTIGKPSAGNEKYTQRKIISTQPIKMIIFHIAEISTLQNLELSEPKLDKNKIVY
jgi:hypothetical protein